MECADENNTFGVLKQTSGVLCVPLKSGFEIAERKKKEAQGKNIFAHKDAAAVSDVK